jgi:hypothetical protein
MGQVQEPPRGGSGGRDPFVALDGSHDLPVKPDERDATPQRPMTPER